MELGEQLDRIATRQDLAEFVAALAEAAESAESLGWENLTLPAFLEALAAWTGSMDSTCRNMGEAVPEDRVRAVLVALIELLDGVGETGWADAMRHHLVEVEEARDRPESPELLQFAVRHIIALAGGMGSFSDLVLQTPRGVALPEQDRFEELQNQLFEAAADELR
ncbi:hypothetical protein GCM10009850_023940 [Nonomuraea monospora]|uniref:Uncharacterized protein n=1 Tax=Nonomuraea monospora TaxID=568818 RepID=A0ABN3CC63_9ACTN